MSFFTNFSVEHKIQSGCGILSVLCLVLSGLSLVTLSRVNSSTVDVDSHWMPSVRILGDIRNQTATLQRAVLNYAICDTSECQQKYSALFQTAANQFATLRSTYDPMITSDEEREQAKELDTNVSEYKALGQQAMTLSASGQKQEAEAFIQGPLSNSYEKIRATLSHAVASGNAGADKAAASAESAYRSARMVLIVAMFLVLIVSLVCGRVIARLIATPIIEASKLLERVAQKDLTQTMEVKSNDEVGKMVSALNTMIVTLRDMLQHILADTELLNQSTMQISAAANQTSHATHDQSEHVQHVAAASQEMVAVITEISQNTEKAAIASRDSAKSAQNGGDVVRDAVNSMEHISKSNADIVTKMKSLGASSLQIGTVVSVIQDIADQTNLLALNAAIESARAGEHGRGFAVVAGEVRRLAERTRKSTEEISNIISAIQAETKEALSVTENGKEMVTQGLERAEEAGRALDSIISTANSSEQMVTLVATAASEQTSASLEVSQNMEKIAIMIEQASGAADQTAEACKDLTQLATNLEATVGQFKLREGGSSITRRSSLSYSN